MNQRNEIIIIGGGVIGACIAYYLSGEKHDVALVEKIKFNRLKDTAFP
jgi:glycine/D-amino acid oxidase-like deaminating enzyme